MVWLCFVFARINNNVIIDLIILVYEACRHVMRTLTRTEEYVFDSCSVKVVNVFMLNLLSDEYHGMQLN